MVKYLLHSMGQMVMEAYFAQRMKANELPDTSLLECEHIDTISLYRYIISI